MKKPKTDHFLTLVRGHPFIGGHLFEHIQPDVPMPVLAIGSGQMMVRNIKDSPIWVSNTARRKYFVLSK